MTLEPVATVTAQSVATAPKASNAANSPAAAQAFGALMEGGLAELGARLDAADGALRAYAAGEPVAVHDLVIAMEEARVSLQFAVEVRNRVVEAYQELMRMQV